MEKNDNQFRQWLRQIWWVNREEHHAWGQPGLSFKTYWNMYRWWLRREYRHQVKHGKI